MSPVPFLGHCHRKTLTDMNTSVPGHAGIYYNELADSIAKSALKQQFDHPYGSITLSACKKLVAMHVEDLWQLYGINHPQDALPIHTFQSSVTTSFFQDFDVQWSVIQDCYLAIQPWMFIWNAWAWQSVAVEGESMMSTTSFLNARTFTNSGNFCQDTLTGPNSVALNLTVSLLMAPQTNNNLSRRQCTDILEATCIYSTSWSATLISISAHCSFLYFCINNTAK